MGEPKPVFEFDIPLYRVESPTIHQVKPEQKAIILCWMWLADQATSKQKDPEQKSSSMSSAADIASDFTKKEFKLDVTAQSVKNYYELGREKVEHAGFKWDHAVAATIERSLGPLDCFDFKQIFVEYEQKDPRPSGSARMMMEEVDRQALGAWKSLVESWEGLASGKLKYPPDLDTELEVAYDISQSPLTPTHKIQQKADHAHSNDEQ